MAAAFKLHDNAPEDLSCVCGLVAPEVEGILLATKDQDRRTLEKELVSECDKQVLLEAREKIFELAKEKVLRCMDDETVTRVFGDAFKDETHDRAKTLKSFIDKWRLTPRRVEHTISNDVMELLYFVLGEDAVFPGKIVRETSLNKGILEDDHDSRSLSEKFRQDVEKDGNKATVEVLENTPGGQLCRVNIDVTDTSVPRAPPVPTTASTQPQTPKGRLARRSTAGQPAVSMQGKNNADANVEVRAEPTTQPQVPKEGPARKSPSKQPVVTMQSKGNEDANEKEGRAICARCKQADLRVTKGVDRATSTDDLVQASDDDVVNSKVPKLVRTMATQTDKEERPILRTEFDYQSEYVEGKIAGNERKVNDLNRWRNGVQGKVKEVDTAGKKNAKDIEMLSSSQNAAQRDLEQYKESVEARFIAMFAMIDNKPEIGGQSEAEPMPDEYMTPDNGNDGDNESIWDIRE